MRFFICIAKSTQVADVYNRRSNNVPDGLTPEEFLNGVTKEEVFGNAKNPVTKAVRISKNKAMRCGLSRKKAKEG